MPFPGAADPRRWRALAVTQIAGFMTLLDVSIVNVALPSVQRGLGASAETVQWVVSGYALAFGLALVPAGRDYPAAVSAALLCAVGVMLVALLLAVAELVRRRPLRLPPAPAPHPQHHVHHL